MNTLRCILILMLGGLFTVTTGAQETMPTYVEQALHEVWSRMSSDTPIMPDRWDAEAYPPTSNSSMGCPSVIGTPISAPVTPYRVSLYFGETVYILHVSEWGEYVVPCSPNLNGDVPSNVTPQCVGAPVTRLQVAMRGRVTPGLANNLRTGAGVRFRRIGQIPPSGEFVVINGPACADGYYWYEVDYNGRRGWTAEGVVGDYWLEPVEPPLSNTNPSVPSFGQTFVHRSLGFSLDVPTGWQVSESDTGMILSKGTLQLLITTAPPSGLPAGERITFTAFTLKAGIDIRRDNIVYQNRTKAVMYQFQGLDRIPLGDLQLVIMLTDTSADYNAINLSEATTNMIDTIVATLNI